MGNMTAPVELYLLTYALGIALAYWAGRESGRAKEQRIRRVHVDDAFRRGKQSGYAFLDTIDVARTEAMSEVLVLPIVERVLGHANGGNVFDYEQDRG